MFWFAITHIFSAILELLRIGRLSEKDEDLEILVLRHQLDVMTRLQSKTVKPNRVEKLTLAGPAMKLKQSTNHSPSQLHDVIRIITPETVFRWHHELVRHKWTREQLLALFLHGRNDFLENKLRARVCRILCSNPQISTSFI